MKKQSLLLFIGLLFFVGCKNNSNEVEWKFVKKIELENISPTGIAIQNNFLWLSDVKNNRVIKIDLSGNIVEEYSDIKRPMHISIYKSKIFVPEYLTDNIITITEGKIDSLQLNEKPNAPSGVAVNDSIIAVADFYNHRIILIKKGNIKIIGKEGHKKGEIYYPTDVALLNDKVYVADAYNNRVQVFDYNGNPLKVIGDKDKINVATGIEVTEDNIFITDFEGSRILIYNLKGGLIKILINNFNKPTDITSNKNKIYVSNYGDNSVSVISVGQ